MRKAVVIPIVLVLAAVLLLAVLAAAGAGAVWLIRHGGPRYRIEAICQMDQDGAAPGEADAELAAQILRKVVPGAESVKREAGSRLSLVIAVPCAKELLEDPSEAGQMKLADEAKVAIENYRQLLEGMDCSLGLHHVDACGTYQYDAERWKKALAGEKLPGYVLRKHTSVDRSGRSRSEDLLLVEQPVVDDKMIARALASQGDQGHEIDVWLRPQGTARLAQHTSAGNIVYERDRLAIVLNDEVKSAPTVQSQLGGNFRVTGRFTREEAERLARVLNCGGFPCRLKLVSSRLLKTKE
jgi:hypothetical protein